MKGGVVKIDTKEIREKFGIDRDGKTCSHSIELKFIQDSCIQIMDLCDSHDELERKLKIAVDALEYYQDEVGFCAETGSHTADGKVAREALKQIRGEE